MPAMVAEQERSEPQGLSAGYKGKSHPGEERSEAEKGTMGWDQTGSIG